MGTRIAGFLMGIQVRATFMAKQRQRADPLAAVSGMAGRPRWDWDRYGRPRLALFTRALSWLYAAMAVPLVVLSVWLAATRDWTVCIVAVTVTAMYVLERVTMRVVYGVKTGPPQGACGPQAQGGHPPAG